MFQLELYLYIDLKNEEDVLSCCKAESAEDVNLQINSIENSDLFLRSGDQTAVVITDNPKFACSLAASRKPTLDVVFCGEDETVFPYFGNGVLDIWPLHEDAALCRARCTSLIRRVRDRMGYRSYKKSLSDTTETPLDLIVDSIPFPVVIVDPEWKVKKMNEDFRGFLEANGESDRDFSYQDWKNTHFLRVQNKKTDKERHSQAEEVEIELLGTPSSYIVTEREIRDSEDHLTGYVCLFQDITFQRIYEQRILTVANTDAMTGLYNRRYFYEYMKQMAREPMTLLYMDLDHFKEVNDTAGHDMGDKVIIRTSELIKECFPDGVGSRLGGDEFAVVLHGKLPQEALTERCRKMEEEVRKIPCGEGLFVTVSIGVARSSGSGFLTTDELIKIADRQMYDVKAEHHKESGD